MDPPSSPPRISITDRRQHVPLLLSSFPAPPTHIPVSPLTPLTPSPSHLPPLSPRLSFTNPPLTAPPASPLPPVPGPSPISEHDTLMFMSAARTRRSSKVSLASSSSRYSTASVVSGHQAFPPPLSPSVSSASLDPSNRSLRSFESSNSLSFPPRGSKSSSSLKEPQIREEDSADLTRMSLEEMEMSMSMMSGRSTHGHGPDMDLEMEMELGLSETEDVESLLEFGLKPSLSNRGKRPAHRDHGANDSISSIDMRDLPALEEDDQEFVFPVPPQLPISSLNRLDRMKNPAFPSSSPLPSPSPIVRQFSVRKLNKDLPPIPSPSFSKHPIQEEEESHRSASPDINTILASTPKPRRKSASSLNASARSRSNSRPRRSSTRTKAPRRRVSESQVASGSGSTTSITITVDSFNGRRSDVLVRSELPYAHNAQGTQIGHEANKIFRGRDVVDDDGDNSDVSDYGVAIDATGTAIEMFDRDIEERLERQLDGDGSDSDSDIDLHTPLPNLMLRDGLLSPNSKLLPNASRSATPQSMLAGRPGSIMSVASTVMTKSGIYKDQRDTVQRRVRHRDGKLLRGGIGLTTGLGWSDSEDEDAPSPLTRRLSSLALTNKPSSSSLRPSGSGLTPTRSVSETLRSVSSTLEKHSKTRAAVPPTSWTHSSLRNSTRSSTTSTDSFISGGGGSTRTSASSFGSSTSRRTSETTKLVLDHIREHEETAHDTSSTASTSSLPMPVTPMDDFASNDHSWAGTPRKEAGKSNGSISSIKTQTIRRIPSGIPPPGGIAVRTRTTSTSSNSSHHAPPLSAPIAGRMPVPRPLRLPQSSSSSMISSSKSTPNTPRTMGIVRSNSDGRELGKSAASRIRSTSGGIGPSRFGSASSSVPPSPAASRLARPSMPSLKQPSTSASTSTSNIGAGAGVSASERPKPRTGTGMVYRTSSRSTPSIRSPTGSLLRPPVNSGVAV